MSTVVPTVPVESATRTDSVIRRLLRRPSGALSAAVVLLLVIATVGAPLFAPYAPTTLDFAHLFAPPSRDHLFGTDELGRDIFARTVHGARISLASALAAVLVALVVGALIGLVAGYLEGNAGLWLMALIDLLLAIPAILLAITLAARLGPGLQSAMIAAAQRRAGPTRRSPCGRHAAPRRGAAPR